MNFNNIKYTRPDYEIAISQINDAAKRLSVAKSFEEADSIFVEVENIKSSVSTMSTLANIRHDIDTKDEFYNAEVEFLDNIEPELREAEQIWAMALMGSRFRDDFAKKYNELMFARLDLLTKSFSPEIMDELREENALVTDYEKLLASAQIDFNGEVLTISQIGPYLQSEDDNIRDSAWQAYDNWMHENNLKLDEYYSKLTKLRDSIGKKLGYDDFTKVGYYRLSRSDYDHLEVEKFRAAVVKYVVPIATELVKKQADRIGKPFPLSYSDVALKFRNGNPKPASIKPEDILKTGREFYHNLSKETAEFIDLMLDNELFDVVSRKGKSGGGYCTFLESYKSPFIFANFNGTAGDVEVITHEAGHAFAVYTARNILPSESKWATLEACEVHSMSMEFFAWSWANEFFGKDADKFKYKHLADALTFIPYGTMVDHFQHIVYAKPDLSPEERNSEWNRLTGIYMPWIKHIDELKFYKSGRGWQRQSHIFSVPFYYIDYCLAQTVALQFWAAIEEDKEAAWEKYMKYTSYAGTKSFTELIKLAGLKTPFGEDSLKTVSEAAQLWLSTFDFSNIS